MEESLSLSPSTLNLRKGMQMIKDLVVMMKVPQLLFSFQKSPSCLYYCYCITSRTDGGF
jgi:hypothetical protein